MIRFLTDENFDNDIMRGVLRRNPSVDILRVQDVGLIGEDDQTILEWAATENRILLTHDVRTVTNFAYQRVAGGLPMPGVFEVNKEIPLKTAIEEILIIAECSLENEWEGQVRYLPLK